MTRAVPRHVAIVMDGNGRWARKRLLPRAAGHRAGAGAVRNAVRHAAAVGIRYLTVFAFSSENWRRPADEVGALMRLFLDLLDAEVDELDANGVRLSFIGDRAGLALGSRPDPDLFIRTGGEQRISNFLLWNLAYAELYFTPTLWPDFDDAEFDRALGHYAARERRYGMTSEQVR